MRALIRNSLLFAAFGVCGVTAAEQMSVAVLPLANLSLKPDLQYLSSSLPDSLATTLKNTGKFSVRSRKDMKAVRQPDGSVPFNEALSVCRSDGDALMITGDFALIGDTIRISLEAVDVKTARVKIAEAVIGQSGIGIFDLVDSLCAKMADRMLKELPRLQESAAVREKISVETVYLQGSRKNSWFFTELGLAVHGLLAEEKLDHGQLGNVTLVSLGYGYRGFRFIFSGCPPIFVRQSTGTRALVSYNNEIEALLEYSLLAKRLQLIAGYRNSSIKANFDVTYFDGTSNQTNFQDYNLDLQLLVLGARYKPVRSGYLSRFTVSLKAGLPLVQKFRTERNGTELLTRAKSGIFLKTEIEWMFLSTTGVRLGYAYTRGRTAELPGPFNALDRLALSAHSFYCSLCYNMDF